jgi:hypothetical protein
VGGQPPFSLSISTPPLFNGGGATTLTFANLENTMIAKMKCSNCGAEMSNLNMSWGRKQMWFMIPVMILGFSPLIRMTFFKGDATKDLVISEVRTRSVGKSLEIVGLITNLSKRQWSSVTVDADFFDSNGVFIDKASEYLRSDIGSHAKEHFKITIPSPQEQVTKEAIQPVLKVSGGHTSPF